MRHEPLVTLPPSLIAPDAVAYHSEERGARFVMGVDGGATKTLAAVLDVRERVLYLGHGGSSNPDAVGAHAATDSLVKATDEAIARAGIAREQLDASVLAIAGTDTEAVAAHMRERHASAWVVVNDVVGAWAAATDARPGVGVISGTGSNVLGVGPAGPGSAEDSGKVEDSGKTEGSGRVEGSGKVEGSGRAAVNTRVCRAGGWGHVLGDEGSGYWLALESIKAALRDRERSGPETALSAAAMDFFDVSSVEALAALAYSKPLSKGEIAAFAIETARVAYAGDVVARELYARAAGELTRQVAAVIEQTGLVGEFPVGLIGSAFKAGELFVGPLAKAIRELAPQAQVAVVEMAPVGGCVLLAARATGARQAVDPAELKSQLDAALAREGAFRD